MDYYKRRKEVISMIDRLIEKGVAEKKILFIIEKNTGFGKKIVKDRIKLYEEVAEPLKPTDMTISGDD